MAPACGLRGEPSAHHGFGSDQAAGVFLHVRGEAFDARELGRVASAGAPGAPAWRRQRGGQSEARNGASAPTRFENRVEREFGSRNRAPDGFRTHGPAHLAASRQSPPIREITAPPIQFRQSMEKRCGITNFPLRPRAASSRTRSPSCPAFADLRITPRRSFVPTSEK